MELTRREALSLTFMAGAGIGFGTGVGFSSLTQSNRTGDGSGNGNGDNTGGEPTTQETTQSSGQDIELEGWTYEGDEDADIVIVYWGDYQCPYCSRFVNQTMPDIRSNYTETGKVQFVEKQLPLFGPGSLRSANAILCAWNQGISQEAHREYTSKLYQKFEEAEGRNSGWASAENLAEYAAPIEEIDENQVQTCVENEEYSNKIDGAYQEADSWGLEGTPFFLIYERGNIENNTTIVGAQPYSRFEEEINSLK